MCMSVCVCACVRARAVGDFGDLHHLIQEHPSSETTMWANKHKPQIPLAVIGTQLVLGPRNGTRTTKKNKQMGLHQTKKLWHSEGNYEEN